MNITQITALILFCFLSFHSEIIAQIDLEEGLIAFYPFNGDANDVSGNDFDPLEIDNPTLSLDCNDEPNSAYHFDGEEDFIEIDNYDDLNFSQSSVFTIALWVKAPLEQVDVGGSVNDLISKWDGIGVNPYPFNLRLFNQSDDRSGKVWIGQYDSSTCGNNPSVISDVRINDDKWHHIIFMRDEEALLKLYIDGVVQGSIMSNIQCNLVNDSNILFGLRFKNLSEKRAFTGSLDNVRFYNRELTEEEIQYLFNKELTRAEEIAFISDVVLFPNPVVEGRLLIRYPSNVSIENIQIFNSLGKEVIFEDDGVELNMQSLRTGVYYIRISIRGGTFIVKKVINVNPGRA